MIIEEIWARLFYSLYKWAMLDPLQKPCNWLLKKLGYTMEEHKELFTEGKPTSSCILTSRKIMMVWTALTMFELFYLFTILTGHENWYAGNNAKTHTTIIYFSLGFSALLADWYFFDRKNKHDRYIKKFEKETRKKHIVWYLITLIWIVSPFFIFNIIDGF